MSSPSKSALSYRRVALAIALSLGTIIFHTILCVLLSYSILDLISPHSRINAGKHTNSTNNSTVAVSNMTAPTSNSNTTAPIAPAILNSNQSTPSSFALGNASTDNPDPTPETEVPPPDSGTSS